MALERFDAALVRMIIRGYQEGKSFSQLQRDFSINRHVIPHLLRANKIPLRRPWVGTKAEWSKAYEKTPKGFLMRTYRNMQSRVTGVQAKKAHIYKGLPILSRQTFYEWAWNNPDFWRLYKRWAEHLFDRKLSPSINRIDSQKGYLLGNIEWLTHSVNSALGGSSPRRRSLRPDLSEVYAHVQA